MYDMEQLRQELFALLRGKGAALCGAADMAPFAWDGLNTGVSVAVPVPDHIVEDLKTAPTLEYREAYRTLNGQLNEIVSAGEDFLTRRGFRAYACTTGRMKQDETWCVPIPHKTFAVRAGLGWIGKSCLLVTEEYGSAIRLSSLLTDAPLPVDRPVTQSRCGACRVCVDRCPGQALTGALWTAGMERSALVSRERCKEAQLRRMEQATGLRGVDLCGLCFAVCPYTQRRLNRTEKP